MTPPKPAAASPQRQGSEPMGADADRSTHQSAPPADPQGGLRIPRVIQPPGEIGGPQGPEPTRYGDWERGGRCIDF